MTDTPSFLAERLRVEGDKTIAFFSSLDDEKWRHYGLYRKFNWTVRNIIVHFITAEQGFIQVIQGCPCWWKGRKGGF